MPDPYVANGFICVTDLSGYRNAFRLNSISSLSDASEDRTESVIVANGGRTSIVVPNSLETLLDEIVEAQPFGGPRR